MPHSQSGRTSPADPVLRSRARRRALQAVYAMQMSGVNAPAAIAQFAHEQEREQADLAYFEEAVHGVGAHRAELDAALRPFLDREMEEVDQVERAMLRIAAWELRYRVDVPYRVMIDGRAHGQALWFRIRAYLRQRHT